MPRKPRELKPEYCYHITVRCNNREFKLNRRECREVLLFAIKKAQEKFRFKLYALCIMSNHTHYMLEPEQPEHLPKIMHYWPLYSKGEILVGKKNLKSENLMSKGIQFKGSERIETSNEESSASFI